MDIFKDNCCNGFTSLPVFLIFFFLVVLYKHLTRNHNYWSSRGVFGPRPWPFFGTYFCQFFVPFQVSEMERYQKYGKIYGIYDGTEPGLIVGDPEFIKQIMIGSTALSVFPNRRPVKTTHRVMSKFLSSLEGEEWKRVRSITAPTFSSGKLKSIIPIMTEAAKDLIQNLQNHCSDQSSNSTLNELDLKAVFEQYTMDVIAKSAFATYPTPKFVSQASQLFTFPFWRKFLDYVMPMWILDSVLLKFTVLPSGPMDFFRNVTISAIRSRRQNSGEKNHKDFLQLLMDASSNQLENENFDQKNLKSHENFEQNLNSHQNFEQNLVKSHQNFEQNLKSHQNFEQNLVKSSQKLSEDEILAQSVLFFSVGFETASQLLTYTTYCLALNPEIQDKLYQEILKTNGQSDDEIINCDYLNAVIDESLRIYNPVLRMERRALFDFPLGNTVGIPVWALHHSPEYFPDPEVFNPDRFMPENKGKIIPSTYLPFGEGPRNCIGMRFALMESKLALAKIIQRFKFVKSKSTKVPLEFYTTGRPLLGPKSVIIGVEKRL